MVLAITKLFKGMSPRGRLMFALPHASQPRRASARSAGFAQKQPTVISKLNTGLHARHLIIVLASLTSQEIDCCLAGHYVVISGYDAADDLFSVCDPAMAIGHIKIPSGMLQLARSAFGTDEDLLIIPRPLQLQRTGHDEHMTPCQQTHQQETSDASLPDCPRSILKGTTGTAVLC